MPGQPQKISIRTALSSISTHWAPKLIASLNDEFEVKLAKLAGKFVWHSHEDTDELFLVLSGELTIMFEEPGSEEAATLKDVTLSGGELVVVPKGVRHCPVTKDGEEVEVLLFETAGVVNTGDAKRTPGLTNEVEDIRQRV
ncbi:hypothetical protein OIDMADRAFT_21489 [Oidiodendron maius Zn]|uniref:Cupin type-2 domain-containing protein n=1 Tax=Oidiodendron maius (strain Zn) TaxID=913774 RepID=A0A0C3GC38_OIDMZ|nr:hypothetical protein OIDMADRAFT_21489 [Oidiodendron maius Zn]